MKDRAWLLCCCRSGCTLLMCCHSPEGCAGLDRLRWRFALSHNSACLTLLGWWTVTGHNSKVVCAAFSSPPQQPYQSEQKCETLLNSADDSQPSYQLAWLHPWHTPVNTWTIPTVRMQELQAVHPAAKVSVQEEGHKHYKPAQTWFNLCNVLVSLVIAKHRTLKLQRTCFTSFTECVCARVCVYWHQCGNGPIFF